MVIARSSLPVDDFARLLEAARAGDAAAMGRLLERTRLHLHPLARYNIPDDLVPKVAPSDLVQCTFLEAQQHFDQFKGASEAEFSAWLRKILHNSLKDFMRAFRKGKKRQVSREVSLSDTGELAAATLWARELSPAEALVLNEVREAMRECASRLSEQHRRVLQLRAELGHSFLEAGEQMGLSSEATRKLYGRALLALGDLLTERGIPAEAVEAVWHSPSSRSRG
jgi:RNA polymerase sigma-70 factor (ECF subfamily)